MLILDDTIALYRNYVSSMCLDRVEFSLTPQCEPTPFVRCFAIFCMHLCGLDADLQQRTDELWNALRDDLFLYRRKRAFESDLVADKPFLQLLTLTLSALSVLGKLCHDPLGKIVEPLVSRDVSKDLNKFEVFSGKPGTGNQAMFMAILLLHARDYLGMNTDESLAAWAEMHISQMNRFGFWGPDRGMTHLQFQNGYHQYEILEYLDIDNPKVLTVLDAVRTIGDSRGHFAPYPGGGGCYDYDAVFVLTPGGGVPDDETRFLLELTATTLMSEQISDGGFCESLYVRPRSFGNYKCFINHILSSVKNRDLFLERLRYGLTLQRPRHNRIHSHWSSYSRRWNGSDLFDSWFRMLTLARIQVALDPSKSCEWGFINYPGIGFHSVLRHAMPQQLL